jgi:hypothetical protein
LPFSKITRLLLLLSNQSCSKKAQNKKNKAKTENKRMWHVGAAHAAVEKEKSEEQQEEKEKGQQKAKQNKYKDPWKTPLPAPLSLEDAVFKEWWEKDNNAQKSKKVYDELSAAEATLWEEPTNRRFLTVKWSGLEITREQFFAGIEYFSAESSTEIWWHIARHPNAYNILRARANLEMQLKEAKARAGGRLCRHRKGADDFFGPSEPGSGCRRCDPKILELEEAIFYSRANLPDDQYVVYLVIKSAFLRPDVYPPTTTVEWETEPRHRMAEMGVSRHEKEVSRHEAPMTYYEPGSYGYEQPLRSKQKQIVEH